MDIKYLKIARKSVYNSYYYSKFILYQYFFYKDIKPVMSLYNTPETKILSVKERNDTNNSIAPKKIMKMKSIMPNNALKVYQGKQYKTMWRKNQADLINLIFLS
jgi:hypothetical protein